VHETVDDCVQVGFVLIITSFVEFLLICFELLVFYCIFKSTLTVITRQHTGLDSFNKLKPETLLCLPMLHLHSSMNEIIGEPWTWGNEEQFSWFIIYVYIVRYTGVPGCIELGCPSHHQRYTNGSRITAWNVLNTVPCGPYTCWRQLKQKGSQLGSGRCNYG